MLTAQGVYQPGFLEFSKFCSFLLSGFITYDFPNLSFVIVARKIVVFGIS